MPVDPATDHAGRRLTSFLTRAISDLKPKSPNPMPDPVVPPANNLTTLPARKTADDLVPSLTGGLNLADGLLRRIAKAKARHDAAGEKVEKAFGKLDNASGALESLADRAEAEADAVLAKLGQVSNLGS